MPRETPLIGKHRELGARLVEFAGWLMPIQYSGIVEEHRAVREAVGMFDVSHMGEIWLRGTGAVEAADGLATNDVASLKDGFCLYSPLCNDLGGIVDDVLIYRVGEDVLFVVNAANTEKDLQWIRSHCAGNVSVEDLSPETVEIALQGPRAGDVVKRAGLEEIISLERNAHVKINVDGTDVLVSRTGYTGESGFEFYHSSEGGARVWELLFDAGREFGLKPIGLGARDTLRFEMGYRLYGNDIDDRTSPLEAGLGWTVKLDKPDFVGKPVLAEQKARGLRRKFVGMELLESGIPRKGYPIVFQKREVGHVTSGTFGPSVGKGLALGYVNVEASAPGTELCVVVRGKELRAVVTRLPFYTHGSRA